MLEPRTSPRPWRQFAALLLAFGLLLAAAPLTAQEAEEPPAASEPAEEATPVEPDETDETEEPTELEPVEEPEEEGRPEREPRSKRRRHRRNDAQVVVGSSLTIDEDETADEVVVMGGSLTVLGEVYGDATALGGSVVVEGRVTGDVAAVGGSVTLTSTAEVMGGAMSFGGSVEREEGAVVHGEVVELNGPGVHWSMWPRFLSWGNWGNWSGHQGDWFHYSPYAWATSQAWRIFGLIVLALVAFLAYLIGRTPIERIGRRVESEPWKSGLVGLVTQILSVPLLVMVIVILAVSIIGIPFLLLVPFALAAIGIAIFFGWVGVALKLGDLLRARFGWSIDSPYVVLLVGIGGLQIWSLIGHMLDFDGLALRIFAGLFMLFGFLVSYVAWTLATGGAILTRFGTAERWGRKQTAIPPAAPAEELAAPAPAAEPEPQATSDAEPWQPDVEGEDGE
jgi:hypothetical protein